MNETEYILSKGYKLVKEVKEYHPNTIIMYEVYMKTISTDANYTEFELKLYTGGCNKGLYEHSHNLGDSLLTFEQLCVLSSLDYNEYKLFNRSRTIKKVLAIEK